MVESDTNRYDNAQYMTGCYWPYDDQTGTTPPHQKYIIYSPQDRYARLRDFTNEELLTELRRRIEEK